MNSACQSASFAAALEVADHPNYLGDPSIVDSFLRRLLTEALQRHSDDDLDSESVVAGDLATCASAARIFLGRDPDYSPMRGWNRPGMIDTVLTRIFKIDEADPQRRVEIVFMSFLIEFFQALTGSAISEEFRQLHLAAIVQSYGQRLLGLPIIEE